MRPRYLTDTSALLRLHRASVEAVLSPLLQQRAIAVAVPALIEVLYSARAREFDRIRDYYETAVSVLPVTAEVSIRALDVQSLLARTSQHRTAKVVDLMIAACAEVNGLTLLHYDRDFDAIAKVTGQPTMWVVPAGSIP